MAESIRVIVRSRPLNMKEINQGSKMVVAFPGPSTITLNGKPYNFDAVIPPAATQADVYKVAGQPVVNNVITGYNGTVFAYGQTSSGKTHSMIGKSGDPEHEGLIPRIVGSLFEYIVKTTSNTTFLVKVSYLEIYMEHVRDLLDITKDNLPLFEDNKKSTYVKGATERYVGTPEEIFDILEEGKSNRKVASTAMNMDSSRSHSIFTLMLHQEEITTQKTLQSRLYLVDLAGSEKVSKTAAEGQTLDEAKGINKSLSALGNVINALTEGIGHVPYRDSKLTRILQDSLGGNSKTTMIICCSPAAFNESETKSTLLFGMRAKTIKNLVSVNMELSAEEWKKYYMEIKKKYDDLVHHFNCLKNECMKWRKGDKVAEADRCKDFTPGEASKDPTLNAIVETAEKKSVANAGGPISSEVYKDLDNKDEEIAMVSQQLSKVRNEAQGMSNRLKTVTKERDDLQTSNQQMKSNLDTKTKELKDVLQTLEEMTMNVDTKTKDDITKRTELQNASEDQMKAMNELRAAKAELAGLKTGEAKLKAIILEGVIKMKKDLGEIGMAMNPSIGKPKDSNSPILDEEFAQMLIYVSKLRGETQNFVNKGRNGLVGKEAEPYKKIELLESHVASMKKNSDERMSTLLSEKRHLEAELNNMKKENMRMKTDLKVSGSKSNDKSQAQIKQIADHYTKDISDVRQSLNDRIRENQELKDKLDVANAELDMMRKCGLGLDTQMQLDKREIAKNEVRGLEENIQRELGNLSNLRKMFINDLKNRIKKVSHRPTMREIMLDDEDEFSSGDKLSPQQRERINFLENNLESLTKVHKQLVRDNAELRSELPKMEKRVKASAERMKQLESALKESKENALKERKRYQAEIDKIKDSFRNRGIGKAAIAKPIVAGGK